MITAAAREVVEVVKARPGLSRAVAVDKLHGRREARRALLDQVLAAGLIHEGVSYVPIRGGAVRTVRGLFPGPAEELDVLPADDASRLRADRQRIGATAALLAVKLGVSRAQLYRWETGQQPVPPGVDLAAGLEAAQQAVIDAAQAAARGVPRPRRRRRDVEELRRLLRDVRDNPGRGRYAVARGKRRRQLLEQALAAGQLHEAQTWEPKMHQPVLGVFPGPARPKAQPVQVRVEDLEEARLAAGWSRQGLGRRIGKALDPAQDPPAVVAGTTVSRWIRECEVVPGWAAAAAADVLVEARLAAQTRQDRREVVRAAVAAEPGRSRKTLAASLGFTRGNYIDRELDELIAAGEVHEAHAGRHGVQLGLYPGPASPELPGSEVRKLREAAGLTQRQLVDVGLAPTREALRNWEQGVVPIPPQHRGPLLEYLLAQPAAAKPARVNRQGLLDVGELAPLLLEHVQRTGGATRRQLDLVEGQLGSRAEMDRALAQLEADGLIRSGRVGAGDVGRKGRITLGRVGYLPATS